MIELLNIDCMEYMATCEDSAFDLAIVDPPYGIKRFDKIKDTTNIVEKRFFGNGWNNNKPNKKYFDELFRISKNQIIWGGNYFKLPPTRGIVFWDKMITVDNFGDGELAWTSFDRLAKQFRYAWGGLNDGILGRNKKEKNINPAQKPVALYRWLLKNYSEPGQRILDTHLGSGSSAIAAHYFGCDFVGCEIDKEYYEAMMKRFKRETSQIAMFEGI